jgi:hypothetical protein
MGIGSKMIIKPAVAAGNYDDIRESVEKVLGWILVARN